MIQLFRQRETALFGVLILLFIVFSLTVPGFSRFANLADQTRYWVAPGLIAVPMTFIIATGGIDLSVASILALSGMTTGLLFRDAGWPIWFAAFAAILAGASAGAINGAFISVLRMPPLVVTLAGLALFRGLAMGISGGEPIGGFPDAFKRLGQGDLVNFGNGYFLPFSPVALAIAFTLGWFLLRRTWPGRFIELMGENEEAARFAAIGIRGHKLNLYIICGAVCGIASLFHISLAGTALPQAAEGMELEIITCVVIGGTRISGGHASVAGTLCGLLIIGILRFGLDLAGVGSAYIIIVVGCVLIATAVFNEWLNRLKQGDGT